MSRQMSSTENVYFLFQVTPLNKDVYAPYRCKATNPHGEASHTITLKEAFPPNAVADPQTLEVTG